MGVSCEAGPCPADQVKQPVGAETAEPEPAKEGARGHRGHAVPQSPGGRTAAVNGGVGARAAIRTGSHAPGRAPRHPDKFQPRRGRVHGAGKPAGQETETAAGPEQRPREGAAETRFPARRRQRRGAHAVDGGARARAGAAPDPTGPSRRAPPPPRPRPHLARPPSPTKPVPASARGARLPSTSPASPPSEPRPEGSARPPPPATRLLPPAPRLSASCPAGRGGRGPGRLGGGASPP